MNNIHFFHQKVQEDCQLDTETRTEKRDLSRHSVLHLSNNKRAINTHVCHLPNSRSVTVWKLNR